MTGGRLELRTGRIGRPAPVARSETWPRDRNRTLTEWMRVSHETLIQAWRTPIPPLLAEDLSELAGIQVEQEPVESAGLGIVHGTSGIAALKKVFRPGRFQIAR